jgi:hypothetical protein
VVGKYADDIASLEAKVMVATAALAKTTAAATAELADKSAAATAALADKMAAATVDVAVELTAQRDAAALSLIAEKSTTMAAVEAAAVRDRETTMTKVHKACEAAVAAATAAARYVMSIITCLFEPLLFYLLFQSFLAFNINSHFFNSFSSFTLPY